MGIPQPIRWLRRSVARAKVICLNPLWTKMLMEHLVLTFAAVLLSTVSQFAANGTNVLFIAVSTRQSQRLSLRLTPYFWANLETNRARPNTRLQALRAMVFGHAVASCSGFNNQSHSLVRLGLVWVFG